MMDILRFLMILFLHLYTSVENARILYSYLLLMCIALNNRYLLFRFPLVYEYQEPLVMDTTYIAIVALNKMILFF